MDFIDLWTVNCVLQFICQSLQCAIYSSMLRQLLNDILDLDMAIILESMVGLCAILISETSRSWNVYYFHKKFEVHTIEQFYVPDNNLRLSIVILTTRGKLRRVWCLSHDRRDGNNFTRVAIFATLTSCSLPFSHF